MSPAPINTTLPGGGGALTVITDVPDFPPAMALTIAVPAPTPDTRPVWDTVATAPFDVDHVKLDELVGFDTALS
jgi:hypothetical protein